LERQKVAEEVKGLDQPARATLRKYGVRFGAYHIYLPLLLKPAPRVLATQLYALKHEGPETQGIESIERLAASGRTSIAADKDVARALYRIAGYRVCGERAVRVDILERLADIVRPALSWREGAPGQKPAAAFDGRGFTVTIAMTSLTGCSGEEFASILRSLGYRMDKRPKPPAPAPVAAAAEPGVAQTEAAVAAPAVDAMVEQAAPQAVALAETTPEVAPQTAAEAAAHVGADAPPHNPPFSHPAPLVADPVPAPDASAPVEVAAADAAAPAALADASTLDVSTDTP